MKPEPGLRSQYGDYMLDDPGLNSRHRHKMVSFVQCPVIPSGPHGFLTIGYWVPGHLVGAKVAWS